MMKMEKRLTSLEGFALDAIKEAGLGDGKSSITTKAYVDADTGAMRAMNYEVWGRGRDAGNAQIYYALSDKYDRVSVVVENYGASVKFQCFTFKEVVDALKKLIPLSRIDPDPYAAPF